MSVGSPARADIPLPVITAADLAGLPPTELLSRSLSMIIRELGTKPIAARNDVVRGLDQVRTAVFGYAVLHDHAHSGLIGFTQEVQNRLVDPALFVLLDNSLAQVGADELGRIIHELQSEVARAIKALGPSQEEWTWERTEAMLRLLDLATMRRLDEEYAAARPRAMEHVARYIREHADQVFTVDG